MVHREDKEKAGKVLENIGFKCHEQKLPDHEWVYSKGDFEIELHHRLLYDDDMNASVLTVFTDTAWEHASTTGGILYHLELEFHFVYLLLHLRKHFLWAGVGIRQFMDLAVMMRNANLDYEKVKLYIDECNIGLFASNCFALIERWFGISTPLMTAEITDEFFVRSTNTILSDGVFGDMGAENVADNAIMNCTYKNGKFLSVLPVLFPPYNKIKQKYPSSCKNDAIGRLLLPFLWLRRIAESFFNRTAYDRMTFVAKHLSDDKERITELKAWGLR